MTLRDDKQNLTLALPRSLLRRIKVVAAQKETSVSALIRKMLEDLVRREDDYDAAMREALADMERGLLHVGKITWTRDEIHER